MKNELLSVCISGLMLVGLGLAACERRRPAPPVHLAFLQDVSDSQAMGCDCLSATLSEAPQRLKLGRGSQVLLFSTGNAQSAYEPHFAGQMAWLVKGSLENRQARLRKQQAWIGQAEQVCRNFEPATDTPLFLGIHRALEQLQATPLEAPARHTLYVKSDGEETVEPAIKAALADARASLSRLPRLDNRHVSIVFLGLADTIGQVADGTDRRTANRTHAHANRLKQVWRAVFTEPEAVSFVPHCATPANVSEVAQR
jgi:hypothetical protein